MDGLFSSPVDEISASLMPRRESALHRKFCCCLKGSGEFFFLSKYLTFYSKFFFFFTKTQRLADRSHVIRKEGASRHVGVPTGSDVSEPPAFCCGSTSVKKIYATSLTHKHTHTNTHTHTRTRAHTHRKSLHPISISQVLWPMNFHRLQG